jgi:hypothetical protein
MPSYNFKNYTSVVLVAWLLFVSPSSTNYGLRDFAWGAGGTSGSTSTNYGVEALAGETSATDLTSSNYEVWPGLLFTQFANVPTAPTLTNASNYYNKLNLIIGISNNPTDSEFAIAISTDNFASDTRYVQSDNTIGASLGAEDWQTYTNWGGASGEFVVGLAPSTTYSVKVKARQGDYTESPWGPVTSTATSGLTLSFDIDVSSIDEETVAPYTLAFGSLTPGSVATTTNKVWIDLSTNAANGGYVYVYGTNSGLYSAKTSYTISSVSGNLTALGEGFGLQYSTVGQSAGGPLAPSSPFDGSSENVGSLTPTAQLIFNTTSNPITSGRGSFVTKAKASGLAPAATDYTDTMTLIAVSSF